MYPDAFRSGADAGKILKNEHRVKRVAIVIIGIDLCARIADAVIHIESEHRVKRLVVITGIDLSECLADAVIHIMYPTVFSLTDCFQTSS